MATNPKEQDRGGETRRLWQLHCSCLLPPQDTSEIRRNAYPFFQILIQRTRQAKGRAEWRLEGAAGLRSANGRRKLRQQDLRLVAPEVPAETAHFDHGLEPLARLVLEQWEAKQRKRGLEMEERN